MQRMEEELVVAEAAEMLVEFLGREVVAASGAEAELAVAVEDEVLGLNLQLCLKGGKVAVLALLLPAALFAGTSACRRCAWDGLLVNLNLLPDRRFVLAW